MKYSELLQKLDELTERSNIEQILVSPTALELLICNNEVDKLTETFWHYNKVHISASDKLTNDVVKWYEKHTIIL